LLANQYALEDTESLRQHNIDLYYRVVHQLYRRGRSLPMVDCFGLINLYLKLGFTDRAEAVLESVSHHPVILTYGARLFRENGEPQTALGLLDRPGLDGPRERLIRAQCLYDLNRLDESERMAEEVALSKDMQLASLQVALASRLCRPVETYLEKEDALLDARMEAMLLDRGP
jgi:hypothetical protein